MNIFMPVVNLIWFLHTRKGKIIGSLDLKVFRMGGKRKCGLKISTLEQRCTALNTVGLAHKFKGYLLHVTSIKYDQDQQPDNLHRFWNDLEISIDVGPCRGHSDYLAGYIAILSFDYGPSLWDAIGELDRAECVAHHGSLERCEVAAVCWRDLARGIFDTETLGIRHNNVCPQNISVDAITHSLRIRNWRLARRKYAELDELYVTNPSDDTGFRSIDDKKGNVTTSTSDAMSAALVIIWICTGQTFTSADDKIFAEFEKATHWCPEMLILTKKCLNPNPNKRPTLDRLITMTNNICSLLDLKGARTAEVIQQARCTVYDPEKGSDEIQEYPMYDESPPTGGEDDDEIIITLDPDDEPMQGENGEIQVSEEEIDLMKSFDD